MRPLVWTSLLITGLAHSQITTFPYIERFDSTIVPQLPTGWITSTNRSAAGDFVTTTSSPRSSPNAVISTNSNISQFLISPRFDFSGKVPDRLQFYLSRSSTHTSGVMVEASLDNGRTFSITLGDTLFHPGSTGYVLTSLLLPTSLAHQPSVRFRWRIVGGSGGTTATFRFDDVMLTVQPAVDLALTRLTATRTGPTTVSLEAEITNLGVRSVSDYTLMLFRDENNNGRADVEERLVLLAGPPVFPQAIVQITHEAFLASAGEHRFIGVVRSPEDENPSNDTLTTILSLPAPTHSLVINEIMFDPATGQNEWVELFNRDTLTVNLSQWRISDRPTASGNVNSFLITNSSRLIRPGEFVVIAAESTLFSQFPSLRSPALHRHVFILNRSGGLSLGNDGDDIVLTDHTGRTIDSVSYSPRWHHPDLDDTKGRSLERINPTMPSNDARNWSSTASRSGGTPGETNSIFTRSLPASAALSFHPNPFSPDRDGQDDFCIIRYNLPHTTSLMRLSIYDVRGRLLRRLADHEIASSSGEVIWDGLDDERQRVLIGPYVVLIEALDAAGATIAIAKGVVVVATNLR